MLLCYFEQWQNVILPVRQPGVGQDVGQHGQLPQISIQQHVALTATRDLDVGVLQDRRQERRWQDHAQRNQTPVQENKPTGKSRMS